MRRRNAFSCRECWWTNWLRLLCFSIGWVLSSNIPDKKKHSFASFDINSFYPSITESLLSKAISFAKKYVTINDRDTDIIMHCRKSLLFDNETAWTKKNQNNMFDVTMGSFDGAEVCELIGLFILNILSDKYGKNNVGLYRDDGLVLLRNTSGPQSERTRKDITREFKKQGLDITISTNLKICNFLDVTLNLKDGTYYPYRKPNNETLYVNTNSNHPPTIIKHLPSAVGRRISDISSNKELFNKAKPHYENALRQSGHGEELTYSESMKSTPHSSQNRRKNRQRNIIWFNPPYSMNVQTNIGREFLNLVSKHFPKKHRYNKIFNKNTVKVSYSCTDNLQTIIKKHNRKNPRDDYEHDNLNGKKLQLQEKERLPPEKQLPDLKRNLQRQRNNRKRRSRDELHWTNRRNF